jgi:hypothetical protein
MVLIIEEMFDTPSERKTRGMRVNPYGAGGSDAVFLHAVSATTASLRRFAELWRRNIDNVASATVRTQLIEEVRLATHFDLGTLAVKLEALMRHVRLRIDKDPSLKEAFTSLGARNASFKAAIDGFTRLLLDFDTLQKEFDQRHQMAVLKFAGK